MNFAEFEKVVRTVVARSLVPRAVVNIRCVAAFPGTGERWTVHIYPNGASSRPHFGVAMMAKDALRATAVEMTDQLSHSLRCSIERSKKGNVQ